MQYLRPEGAENGGRDRSSRLLPESGKIIHSLKLQFGVLESRHSLLQCWTHRG